MVNRKTVMVGVVASVLTGSILAGVAHSKGLTDSSDPGAIVSDNVSELAPTPDAGDVATTALLRTRVPKLLTADVAQGRLPNVEVGRRLTDILPSLSPRRRTAELSSVWTTDRAAARAADWISALRQFAPDPSYTGYTDNTLTVTQWQGITVSGDSASAVFIGHPNYLLPTGWSADEDDQYQVGLKRQDGTWLLSKVARVDSSVLDRE